MRRGGSRLAQLGGVLVGLVVTLAGEPAAARVRWLAPGHYRLRLVSLGEVPLDGQGTDSGQHFYGRHRLRIGPNIEAGPLFIHVQVDVLTGQTFGDTTSVGARYVERRHGDPEREFDGWTTVEPRMLWLELRTPWAVVRVGQLGDRWGLGLLAGDGNDPGREEEHWVERFGDRWNGDLVDRLSVEMRPLAPFTYGRAGDLVLAFGGDHIYQDDGASFLDGDSAWRLFVSAQYPGEEVFAGTYVVHRSQTDRDGDTLSVTSYDVYGRWLLPLYTLNADLRLQAEALLRMGTTDRQRPQSSPDGVDILQLGWAGRGEIAWRCPRIATGLEVGYASGDQDPGDGEARDLTFDPDHRVGFLLFPDVLRLMTLRSADRMADPDRVGRPPEGVEQTPTDGAVRNALYVQPGVTWRPGAWRLSALGVLAWAAEPYLDPVETFAAGGDARNHQGRAASRFYGYELDGAVHRGLALPGWGSLEVGVQAGLFVSGSALQGPGDDPVLGKLVGRIDLRW